MKRILCALLSLVLLCGMLAGCGGNSAASSSRQSSTAEVVSLPEEQAEQQETIQEPQSEQESQAASSAEQETQTLTDDQRQLLSLIPEGEALTFQEYPLTEDPDEGLSVFYSMHPLLGQFYESAADLPISAAIEEKTGVHIDYNCVSFMAADT